MNKNKIATEAAEDAIKYLQRYLKEQENFNIYISNKGMEKIENLIKYLWEKTNDLC
jgi:hypothetical protein